MKPFHVFTIVAGLLGITLAVRGSGELIAAAIDRQTNVMICVEAAKLGIRDCMHRYGEKR